MALAHEPVCRGPARGISLVLCLLLQVATASGHVPRTWADSGSRLVRGSHSLFANCSASIPGSRAQPNHLWPGGPSIHLISWATQGGSGSSADASAAAAVTLAINASSAPQLPQAMRVLCVVDGRAVLEAATPSLPTTCDLSFLSFGGMHSVAAYGVLDDGRVSVIGKPLLLTREAPPPAASSSSSSAAALVEQQHLLQQQLRASEAALVSATPAGTASLGVYYTTYLNPLQQLYQNMTRATGRTVTLEGVLRNTSLRFADSVWGPGAAAAGAWWVNYSASCDPMHQEPALGMYCFYACRANESVGPTPDCPEGGRILAAHAAQLSSAGFTWVSPDATNWDGDPRNQSADAPSSDFYQLRPMEIIADAWAAARLGGAATPQLSVFAKVGPGGDLWRWYMSELFNNGTLLALDLVYRAGAGAGPGAGKKVFIAADLGPSGTNYSLLGEIASNGGAEDVVVPLMWFAPNASGAWEASGRLAYFGRCIARHVDTGALDFSSDAWLDEATPCAHLKTRASPVGSSWTVSTGLSINSVPFGAVRFNGLLLKKQWWDVFADPEPTDVIFAPSWNEFGSRAYNLSNLTGANNPAFYAIGAAPDDPDRFVLFEDGYGAQRSRSIEPSVEDGGRYYETFASCVRVYRLQAALGIVGDGTGCAVAGEDCCAITEDQSFSHVWSLDAPAAALAGGAEAVEAAAAATDAILTSDAGELQALQAAGWQPVCVPTIFGRGPTATCVAPTLPFAGAGGVDAASRGPFVLFSNATTGLAGVVPLARCLQRSSGLHLIANATDGCPLAAPGFEFDALLGFGHAAPDSLFARPVRRCLRAATQPPHYYTAVNNLCLRGDGDEGVLLYAI